MEKILKKYQERLNDVSRRNRSIRLSRIVKRRAFDIGGLSQIDPEKPLKVIQNVFFEGKSTPLLSLNVKTKDEEKIVKDLLHLKRDVDFIQRERGYYEFYLGYPFIQGRFYDNTFFRCPLFIVPISLELNRTTQRISIKTAENHEILINKTFFLAFNKYNKGYKNINLNVFSVLESLKPDQMVDWAMSLFKKTGLEVINSDNSLKNIGSLKPLIIGEEPIKQLGVIEVLPLAVIGQFNQMDSSISNDYDNLMKDSMSNDISDLLMGKSQEIDLEERYDDERIIDHTETDNFFITKPDISQEQILIKARQGKGLVIHGPPGTGKSQVITNLIADNLARNKKLLLVCEKRTALDVVRNRLASKGLHKYAVLIHDLENDRNEVFNQMASVIDELDRQGNDSSSSRFINSMTSKAQEFDQSLAELKKLISFVHDKREFGTSLYQLYRISNPSAEVVLNVSNNTLRHLKYNDINPLSEKVSSLGKLFHLLSNEDHPLYFRQNFVGGFDELSFKEKIIEAEKVFKTLESVIYSKAFQSDIHTLGYNTIEDYESLLKLPAGLIKLRSKNQNKISRLFDSEWWLLKKAYKKLTDARDLDDSIEGWKKADPHLRMAEKICSELQKYFKQEFIDNIKKDIVKAKNNSGKFKRILDSFEEVSNAIILDSSLRELNEQGVYLAELCYSQIPLDKKRDINELWKETILNSFYLNWISKSESEFPSIKRFSYLSYNEITEKLAKTINEKIDLLPKVIHERFRNLYHGLKWDGYDGDGRKKNYNNLKYLLHELKKKKRRLTLRELFEKFYPEGLLDLFPCWMCTPETVSSIFPLKKNIFDIVIFDEASQCKLEKAVPAIIRAKRLIVAGDEKQLPPTSFFESKNEDDEEIEEYDDEEQQLLEDESLLIRAKTILPGKRLLYHYRSKDEDLINFSNYAFYEQTLRIAPRNAIQKAPAIEYKNVRGTWEERRNEKEAKEVVKLVKEILTSRKEEKTIGIITFNSVQRELIKDSLEEEARKDPQFGILLDAEESRKNQDEYIGLFVKNIEQVQGDERDIIIFSISYGYDKLNKFRHYFGPLTDTYGANRLNVAISRAREKIYVIASFDPEELKYVGDHEGPRLLAQYLAYCKYLSEGNRQAAFDKLSSLKKIEVSREEFEEYDSDFEGEVRDALVKRGYKVDTQVGCLGYKVDLAIVNPKNNNSYVVGIECDGAKYHSLKSAKERDIYRQQVLEDNGWKILRVWSRDWWRNEESEIMRLDREIKSLLAKGNTNSQ